VLKVMAGDVVRIKAESYYNMPPGGPGSYTAMSLTDLLGAFAGSSVISAAKGTVTPGDINNIGFNSINISSILNRDAPNSSTANAYLNFIFFDDQLNYVSGGTDPVATNGGYRLHDIFINYPATAAKNGYLYIYVSNESNFSVFFDNLQVTHIRGPLLSENHYYPFGLSMAGISSKALNFGAPSNSYKFNGGSELEEDESINLYSTFFREYDPQLGRFNGVDILSERSISVSGYQFAINNPITFNDPLGNMIGEHKDKWGVDWSSSDEFFDKTANGGFGIGPYAGFYQNYWKSVPDGTNQIFFAPGPITPNMVAKYFSVTWGNSVSNVSATASNGGFNIWGIATSTGNNITDYFQSTERIEKDFEYLAIFEGKEQEGFLKEFSEKTAFGIGFVEVIHGANEISEIQSKASIAIQRPAWALEYEMQLGRKITKFARISAVAGFAIGASNDVINIIDDPTKKSNYAKLAVKGLELGVSFIPVVGWLFSLGIGFADYYGAFDNLYDNLDKK